jgi:heat shock protein HslJ
MKTYSDPTHQMLRRIACLSILAVLILTGCSSGSDQTPAPTNMPNPTPTSAPATAAPNPIQNIIWQWVSVTNQSTGAKTTVPNPANYTISFYNDGTLSGKADCNTFDGTYSQKNGFSIKLGATTMAFCGEASLDQQYTNLLSNVAAGGPDGAGGLALETAGGEQRMLFNNGGATVKP